MLLAKYDSTTVLLDKYGAGKVCFLLALDDLASVCSRSSVKVRKEIDQVEFGHLATFVWGGRHHSK